MRKMVPAKVKEKGAVKKFMKAGRRRMRTIQVSQLPLVGKNALTSFALQKRFTKRSDLKWKWQDIDFYVKTATKTM